MKKSKVIKLLSLLLCLLILGACQPNESVNNGTGADGTQSSDTIYVPSENELLLIADQQSYCCIVYPQSEGGTNASFYTDITKTIRQYTGAGVKRYSDLSEIPEGTVEILIGDTNRAESAQAKAKLGRFEYSISVVNGKLVVVGSDEVMLEYAVARMLEMIQTTSKQGVWVMEKNYDQKSDGSDYAYDAYLGKGIELKAEYTLISAMSPIGGSTSAGVKVPWVQGGCTDGTYYYYCMITNDKVNPPAVCVILKYDLATRKMVSYSGDLSVGHAQDAAYNPDQNVILIGSGDGKFYLVDAETLTLKKSFQLSHGANAISYDENTKQYILARTNDALYFYDADFNLKSKVSISGMLSAFPTTNTNASACQGMTSDGKYVYWLEYWQSSVNEKDIRCYVVILDIEKGDFVDRIALNMGREVENIVIWNNDIYVVCNNISWTGAECYQIKFTPNS